MEITTITVVQQSEQPTGGTYRVLVKGEASQTSHLVKLSNEEFEQYKGSRAKPEELIKDAFNFLLEREPKESILKEFNLSVIEQYFPEFKETITK